MILRGPFNIIFDGVNADLVRECMIRTKCSHRPLKLDADFCSKISCNLTFGNALNDLCHAIVLLAGMLCSEELVDPNSIEGLVACRLIPLDKSPILTVLKLDILNITGYQLLCAGLESGCAVAIDAVVNLFE